MEKEIICSELKNLGSNFGEIVIDSFMKDGLLKEIPIIGTGFSIIKIIKNSNDLIFATNIISFINHLDIKDEETRQKFINKYLKLNNYKKIGRIVLQLLSQSEYDIKNKWYAILLKELINNSIKEQDFLFLSNVIKNSFPDFLLEVKNFNENKKIIKVIMSFVMAIWLLMV